MKIKNTNFFETHFEKLLMGITALVVIAVVYFYVLGAPFNVTISGKEVSAGEVDALIDEHAESLRNRLNSPEVDPAIATLKVVPYRDNFLTRLERPVLANPTWIVSPGPLPIQPGIIDTGDKPFQVPTVPPPTVLAVKPEMGSVDPNEVKLKPELAQVVPAGVPHDTTWVSIGAQFNMSQMIAEFIKPDDDAHRRLQQEWWLNTFGLVDLQVERQEVTAMRGGQPEFGPSETLPVMPGAKFDPRKIPKDIGIDLAAQYIDYIKQHQTEIIQPPFYLLRNSVWAPPRADDAPVGGADAVGAIAVLDGKIAAELRVIEGFKKQLAASPEPNKAKALVGTEQGAAAGDDAEAPAAPGKGPAAGKAPVAKKSGLSGADARKLLIEKQIAQHEKIVASFRAEREKLAPPKPVVAGGAPAPDAAPAVDPAKAEAAKDIFNAKLIDMWTSDMSARAGKSYRYRLRVAVVNPLYGGKGGVVPKSQEALIQQFLLFSDWTAWTPVVHVDAMSAWRIASVAKSPAPGQAIIEIFRYFDGEWRRKESRVKAGDPIGEPEKISIPVDDKTVPATLDWFTGAILVDIDFNNLVPGVGGRPEAKPRLVIQADDEVMTRRPDLDQANPDLQRLDGLLAPAKAAAKL